MTCNACRAHASCKHFQPGSVYALEPMYKGMPSRRTSECIDKLKSTIAIMEQRAWRSLYFEQLRGGRPQRRVTRLFSSLFRAFVLLFHLYKETSPDNETIVLEPGTVLGDIFGAR